MTPETILDHDGIQQPILEWALDYGITPAIIIGRLERGLSIADAITTPMKTGFRGQRLPVFKNNQIATKPKPIGKRTLPMVKPKRQPNGPLISACQKRRSPNGSANGQWRKRLPTAIRPKLPA